MKLHQNDIEYVIRILMRTALPGMEADYQIAGDSVTFQRKHIFFTRITEEEADTTLEGTFPMNEIPSHDGSLSLPIAMARDTPFASHDGDDLIIHADIITLPFFILSRLEDAICSRRDEYGRYSYEDSLAKKYGLIDFPIVDEYALLLRIELKRLVPGLVVKPREGRVIPTHDIDNLHYFRQPIRAIIGRKLVRQKNIRAAISGVIQYVRTLSNPMLDPYVRGLLELLRVSKEAGLVSEFFFMGYPQEHSDYRYDVNSRTALSCMRAIKTAGMVVGFHGGFGTADNGHSFQEQMSKARMASDGEMNRGRQHYLCFDARKSALIWAQNGMRMDMTLGYYDHEGFACGTAHPYPLYNIDSHCELKVWEQPLIAMDGTLCGYRKLSIEQAKKRLELLCNRSLSAEGDFVILWHNSSLVDGWAQWYDQVYLRSVQNQRQQISTTTNAYGSKV